MIENILIFFTGLVVGIALWNAYWNFREDGKYNKTIDKLRDKYGRDK